MNTSKFNIRQFILFGFTATLLSSCASLYIKSGKQSFEDLRYQDAIYSLEKGLAKKDDPAARRMLAESYLMVNNFSKANENYALTSTATDNTDRDRINQGQAKMASGQYAEAKSIFEGIISRDPSNEIAKSMLNSCKKSEEMKKDSANYVINPVNIPSANGLFSSTPYNGGLIVTSPADKGDKDPYTSNAFTDLYFTKQENGGWSTPTPLKNVNSKYHDAVAAISPNGQTLVFTRSFQLKGGKLGGDIDNVSNTQLYTSKLENGEWTTPMLVPFADQEYMFAHPTFSQDGTTLYFSSDKSGGFGGMDLYQSKWQDGAWGNPVNLGSDINTKGDEIFPTVFENRLYFSSTGHETLGGSDINFVDYVDNAWGPVHHMSYPINTSYDDFGLVHTNKENGYLSSDRSGSDRIYSFTEIKSVVRIEGLVNGKESMLPLGGAKVTIQNLTDGTEKTIFTDADGKYAVELEPGKDYKIKSELDGYFAESQDVSTKGMSGENNVRQVFELPELFVQGGNGNNTGNNNNNNNSNNNGKKPAGTYDVPNIYWDYNKWDIRPDAEPYLDYCVKLFKDNPKLKFEIQSHCDSRGSFEFNEDLSSKRAKAVVEYLVKKGVPRANLVSKGYGENQLVNECSDGVYCPEEKHQANRRTEFIVTEKK